MNSTNPPVSEAEQIYILLMHDIEPDLLPGRMETLAAKYAGESPTEREARMERYNAALAAVEEKFHQLNRTWHAQVQDFLRGVRKKAEIDSAADDVQTQADIISQIDHDAA